MGQAVYRLPAGEVQLIAATDLASGEIVKLPDGRAGVVQGLTGVKAGDKYTAATAGLFDVPAASAAIAATAIVYWTGTEATATATDNDPLGRPVAAKGVGVTTVRVDLNGTGPSA